MPPNFPQNPYVGQVYTWQNTRYMWDGQQWLNLTAPRSAVAPVFVSASIPQPPVIEGTLWFNTLTQVLNIWVVAPGGGSWVPVTESAPVDTGVTVSVSPPENPTQGELWYNPHTHLFQIWVFNGVTFQWDTISDCEPDVDGPPVIVSVSPPENPVQGTLWYRPSNSVLSLRVSSLSGGTWVPITSNNNQQKPTVYISSSVPSNPSQGDLWFNPPSNQLKVWSEGITNQWLLISGGSTGAVTPPVYISVDEPVNPKLRYLWFNPQNNELKVWDGSEWELVSTSSTPTPPPSTVSVSPPPNPAEGYLWFNPLTGSLSVWYTDVDGGQWVSATVQGPVGPEGPTGPVGPVGPPPPIFVFSQNSPSTSWTINHNLGYRPTVELIDANGREIDGDVYHQSINTAIILFNLPVAGEARLI